MTVLRPFSPSGLMAPRSRRASLRLPDRLQSDRLVLRRHRRTDARAVSAILNNWSVAEWLIHVPMPYTEQNAQGWISQMIRRWHEGEEYQFLVVARDRRVTSDPALHDSAGRAIGQAGLRTHGSTRDAELGYWLGEAFWGRGYGSEAARMILYFAFMYLRLEFVWATTLPDNDRSIRVLRRIGMRPEGTRMQYFASRGSEEIEVPSFILTRDEHAASLRPERRP